ncbi:glycosyltransferase family 8 protein [Granulicella tundricola]|uniref:Glycosyl transferase family 8 n=1 Tax=Granulicella tundricola (strain ATCC BAA-1859 / DSM 23138 / MP5ACTX9) TaxID=1198114 RepID=E8X7L2_GRATM|nr:glycosyltransferase family 8 protein [Granulicella tundricola]ADW71446.1 glycosyl transferase family 8 [Granulicella tundricola MP5ACTX9]
MTTDREQQDLIPVLFCTDHHYWKHLGVAIASLLAANPSLRFRIIVCSMIENLAAEPKIREIFPAVEFVRYNINQYGFRTDRNITIASYLRLFMTEFVDLAIDKLLYLDCDMVVCGNIQSLWETDLSVSSLAAVPEPYAGQAALGFKAGDPYFNGGTLLINLKLWRAENLLEQFLRYANLHAEHLLAHDQDILNGVLRGRIIALSYRWNFHAPYADCSPGQLRIGAREFAQIRKLPAIVHFVGSAKPWSFDEEPHYKDLYWRARALTPWQTPAPKTKFRTQLRERMNWYFPRFSAVLRSLAGKRSRLDVSR